MDASEEDDDPWPDEPEEFDPDSLGPDPPDPTPEVGSDVEASLGATADVDDDLFRAFWGAVVFLNVALAALALGAMLVYFRGDYSTGTSALAVGLVATVFTVRYYLKGKRTLAAKDDDSDGSESDDDRDEPTL